MNGQVEFPLKLFASHAVEHDGFIALEGGGGNDDEIAFELIAGSEDVLAGDEAGNDDVGAEVSVLDGDGVEASAEPIVQAFEQGPQDGREELAGEDCAVQFFGRLRRAAL